MHSCPTRPGEQAVGGGGRPDDAEAAPPRRGRRPAARARPPGGCGWIPRPTRPGWAPRPSPSRTRAEPAAPPERRRAAARRSRGRPPGRDGCGRAVPPRCAARRRAGRAPRSSCGRVRRELAAVRAPGPPPVAEGTGEQRDRPERREEQQLRAEEDREGDRHGHRRHGGDPRDPRRVAARAVAAGQWTSTSSVLGGGAGHGAEVRRAVARDAAPADPGPPPAAAAGSTTRPRPSTGRRPSSRTATRTPSTVTPLVDPQSSTVTPCGPTPTKTWLRLRDSSSTTRPAAGRAAHRDARRGQRAAAAGIRAADHDEVEHRARRRRRPRAARPSASPGATDDGRTVQERRHPDDGVGRQHRPRQLSRGTGSPRCSASAAHSSAAVDRTDHSTTTSTGWGRRRGTCTVSVISMAATVGRPTDDAAELSTGRHLGGAQTRDVGFSVAERSLVGGGVRPGEEGPWTPSTRSRARCVS